MSKLLKDLNLIWTRLYDHRSYLNGEIQFFLREFEEKRNDREVETLFSILVDSTDIKDTKIDKIKQSVETVTLPVKKSLDASLNICADITAIESTNKDSNLLQITRENRKLEFQNFMDVMSDTCKRIDNTFEEEEEELKDFYIDLEKKLNLTHLPSK